MEGATDNQENVREDIDETQQPDPLPEQSPEELIARIATILDGLFEPSSILNNSYFLKCAINENFEIPIMHIYHERSVRNESSDWAVINKAIENTSNIIVNKKGDSIVSLAPKYNEARRRISIKNIPKEQKDELRNFIYSLDITKEGPCYWNYNYKLNVANLACKEETFAAKVFDVLNNIKFNEEDLECHLENDNLYITGLELMKKRAKNQNNAMGQMNMMNQMSAMNPMYAYGGYNPYQMYPYFAPPANNFYVTNHYQNMNYYYPNMSNMPYQKPIFNPAINMGPGMNQNPNIASNPGMNKKPYNPNYKNDKKPYVKQKRPFNKEKNYKYNNNRVSTKSNSIEVNDNEFPPLEK